MLWRDTPRLPLILLQCFCCKSPNKRFYFTNSQCSPAPNPTVGAIPTILCINPYQSPFGGSINGGTPKSSILIGFSHINHPFWGTHGYPNLWKSQCFFFSCPLVMAQSYGKKHFFRGKSTKNWLFSIAILNYQRLIQSSFIEFSHITVQLLGYPHL